MKDKFIYSLKTGKNIKKGEVSFINSKTDGIKIPHFILKFIWSNRNKQGIISKI